MKVHIMDFIMKMSTMKDAYDALLTVPCKATKDILLIRGKEDWVSEEQKVGS